MLHIDFKFFAMGAQEALPCERVMEYLQKYVSVLRPLYVTYVSYWESGMSAPDVVREMILQMLDSAWVLECDECGARKNSPFNKDGKSLEYNFHVYFTANYVSVRFVDDRGVIWEAFEFKNYYPKK